MEKRESQETTVLMVMTDHVVLKVCKVHQVLLDHQGQLDPQDPSDQLDPQDHQVLLVCQVLLVMPVFEEPREKLVLSVLVVSVENKVFVENPDNQDQREMSVKLVPEVVMANKERKVAKDHLVHKVKEVPQDPVVFKDYEDLKVALDPLVRVDNLGNKAQMV